MSLRKNQSSGRQKPIIISRNNLILKIRYISIHTENFIAVLNRFISSTREIFVAFDPPPDCRSDKNLAVFTEILPNPIGLIVDIPMELITFINHYPLTAMETNSI